MQLRHFLEEICEGRGQEEDIEKIKTLSEGIIQGSLCALGKSAPNPVLTTLEYFREEYEAHLDGNCPAKRCKDLISYSVTDECIGCTLCLQACPVDAIVETRLHEYHMETPGENIMTKDKLLAVGDKYDAMIAADKAADAKYR